MSNQIQIYLRNSQKCSKLVKTHVSISNFSKSSSQNLALSTYYNLRSEYPAR